MRTCELADCRHKHYGLGYCHKHYQRVRAHGDPHTVRIGYRRQRVDVGSRIAARSERRGSCIVFTGGKPSHSGHRLISHQGKMRLVHRVAWELAKGPIAPGLCVLHRCDVPDCVNIDHLFLGSVADNNHDRDRKGRQVAVRGSKHCRAKLTEWQVQQIRQHRESGETISALAKEFGVSEKSIWPIVKGRTWRHVQLPESVSA